MMSSRLQHWRTAHFTDSQNISCSPIRVYIIFTHQQVRQISHSQNISCSPIRVYIIFTHQQVHINAGTVGIERTTCTYVWNVLNAKKRKKDYAPFACIKSTANLRRIYSICRSVCSVVVLAINRSIEGERVKEA
uniref:Uncharacterized protein n=1 Tax=Triticum urartu TaxID=4572 RepID=A0A8R7U0Y0_TRIUA